MGVLELGLLYVLQKSGKELLAFLLLQSVQASRLSPAEEDTELPCERVFPYNGMNDRIRLVEVLLLVSENSSHSSYFFFEIFWKLLIRSNKVDFTIHHKKKNRV